jgi:hypothetical protein
MKIEVSALLTWRPAFLEVDLSDRVTYGVELTLDQRIALPPTWKQDEIEACGLLVVEVTITYAGSPESRDWPADSPEYDVTEATIELGEDLGEWGVELEVEDERVAVVVLTRAQLAALDLSNNADFCRLVIEAMDED